MKTIHRYFLPLEEAHETEMDSTFTVSIFMGILCKYYLNMALEQVQLCCTVRPILVYSLIKPEF